METRRLGRTGLTVAVGGVHASWRERDADGGRKTLTAAIEHGVDVVVCDPAHERALERIVGEVVRDLRVRDRAVVVVRAGAPRARELQRAVEDSLRATRLEVVPIALVDWDDRTLYDGAWPDARDALARLVREGKVLRWGLRAAAPLDECALGTSEPCFEMLSMPYNLIERKGAGGLLANAARHELGVIVTQPLHHGLLGGTWTSGTKFAPDDWRAERYAELAPHLAKATAIDRAGVLVSRETDSTAELALRFALRDGVHVVAPSIRTRAQLDDLLRAADGRALSASLLERLREELPA